MSFTKKYRPSKFSDLVAQDEIKKTLQNIIKNDSKISSFLFFGDRGCGKTSLARIFASAVNCEEQNEKENFDPCGFCQSCISILGQKNLDIIEIDAASNNSVENIRSLIENSKYLPQQSRKKIFILDEAHMLSLNAFNALLKILEEPPEYLIFILITTEYRKIPLTVISRCLRLQFKKITQKQIIDFLEKICTNEKIEYEKEALKTIAILSDGAIRDSLSLLESASILTSRKIHSSDLPKIFGILNEKNDISDIFNMILEKNIDSCFSKISEIISEGVDASIFLQDFMNFISEIIFINSIYAEEIKKEENLKEIDFSTLEVLSLISREKVHEIIFNSKNYIDKIFKFLEILNQSFKILSQNIYQNQENFLKITSLKLIFSLDSEKFFDQSKNQIVQVKNQEQFNAKNELSLKNHKLINQEKIENRLGQDHEQVKQTIQNNLETKILAEQKIDDEQENSIKFELIKILKENHEILISEMIENQKIKIDFKNQIIIDDGRIPSKHLVFILKILRSKFSTKWRIFLKEDGAGAKKDESFQNQVQQKDLAENAPKSQIIIPKEHKDEKENHQRQFKTVDKKENYQKQFKTVDEIKKEFISSSFFKKMNEKFQISENDIKILK